MMTRCFAADFLGWVRRIFTSGKTQPIDIVEVISWPLSRSEVVQTPWRNRQSRCELLSPSEAHWSTTKSDGMWFFPKKSGGENLARVKAVFIDFQSFQDFPAAKRHKRQ
jgi:hypothetical protein